MSPKNTVVHELFPVGIDEDAPAVEKIEIVRFLDQGRQWCYPRQFKADELVNIDQLQEMVGGGTYNVMAKVKGRITAKRTYTFVGVPKPFPGAVDEPTTPATSAAAVAGVPVNARGELQLTPDLLQNPMMMMMFMMQQQRQDSLAAAQAASAAADRQTQLLVAAMGRPLPPEPQRSDLTPVLNAMLALKTNPGGGNGSSLGTKEILELIGKGIEIGAAGAGGDDTISSVVEGVKAVRDLQQQENANKGNKPGVANGPVVIPPVVNAA